MGPPDFPATFHACFPGQHLHDMCAGRSVVVRGWNLEEIASLPADAGGSGQDMPLVLYALQGGQNHADQLHMQWAAKDVRFVPAHQRVPHSLSMHRLPQLHVVSISVCHLAGDSPLFQVACKACEYRDDMIGPAYIATP